LAVGKVSFTSDLWSDKNLRSYLCLTAHWIARDKRTGALELKCALIAFHNVTGRHDGVNLANVLVALLDRAGVTANVRIVFIYILLLIGSLTVRTLDTGQCREQYDNDARTGSYSSGA
jgi:hypothetical protein